MAYSILNAKFVKLQNYIIQISHFPNNYFKTYVRKSDIGKLKYEECLILSERNDSIAREVFSKCITEVINAREEMLNKFKKTLEKVNSFGIENK